MSLDTSRTSGYSASMTADARYPIGAVSVLTGITVDTLRAWERRHRVVTPSRDERGRLYSDADVLRLQLLAAAIARGHPIGRLARLDDAALTGLIDVPRGLPGATLPADPAPPGRARRRASASRERAAPLSAPIGRVLAALRRFDASEVERELGRLAAALPPRELVHDWLVPLMRKTGTEWHAGRLSTAQEHLLSAALRSLLGGIIRAMPQGARRPNLLLATLARDRHEFGVLGAAMLAALSGLRVTYLGCDLPTGEIVDAAKRSGAAVVVLGLTYAEAPARTASELQRLAQRLPAGIELWAGGPLARDMVAAGGRVVPFADFTAFEAGLARLGGRL